MPLEIKPPFVNPKDPFYHKVKKDNHDYTIWLFGVAVIVIMFLLFINR